MTNGIFLSTSALLSLAPDVQKQIFRAAGFDPNVVIAASGAEPVIDGGKEEPVELTVALVRKLTDGLSEKTLNALKVIASSDSAEFHMKDVIEATVGADNYMDMRGVWSALTRRTRNIMNDSNVDLVWWIGDEIRDAQGEYVDHVGQISQLTYRSLRTHFGF